MTLFFAITCSSAFAWEVRLDDAGQEMMWATKEVPYSINIDSAKGLSQAAVETLVAAATRNWSAPLEGQLNFNQNTPTDIQQAKHDDNVNAIYFDNAWTQDPSLLALTYVWSNPEGEIIGFDLAVNATDHSWATDGRADANDLLNTLSHELGHALGIDHSPEIALATMYPSSPAGEIQKRDLHTDDVEAAKYLYATGNSVEATGCSSIPANRTPWILSVLIALTISLRSRENLS
jgi:hypothetical protein